MVGDAFFQAVYGRHQEFQRGDLAPSGVPDQTWTIGNITAGVLGATTGGPPTVSTYSALSAWRVGTAFMKTADEGVCVPANGDMTGLCTRMVVLNPGAQLLVAMQSGMDPLPQPMTGTLGMKMSLVEPPVGEVYRYEAETGKTATASTNGRVVTSGTGAITTATAVGTVLSFINGRLYVAQTGDRALFRLRGILAGVEDPVNNFRVEVEYIGKSAVV